LGESRRNPLTPCQPVHSALILELETNLEFLIFLWFEEMLQVKAAQMAELQIRIADVHEELFEMRWERKLHIAQRSGANTPEMGLTGQLEEGIISV